jgi:hypothetical protein
MNQFKHLTKRELYDILVQIDAFPNKVMKNFGYTNLEKLKDDLLKTWMWFLSEDIWLN